MHQLIPYLRQRFPELEAVYVFGSSATGRETPESDLDVAVLAKGALDPSTVFDAGLESARLIDRDVDLVDLETASTVLAREVIGNGQLLYCRDRAFVTDFEARVLSEYGRFHERTEFIRDAVRGDGLAYVP